MKGNVSFVGFESQITHYWKLAMLLEIHVPQILCEGKITKSTYHTGLYENWVN